jgi:hypothetical protein
MLVTDMLEVDRTVILDRGDNLILNSIGEPEGKEVAFSALHYEILLCIVDLIERTPRIQQVDLIDEVFLEVLFIRIRDLFDRINDFALFSTFEPLTAFSIRPPLLNHELTL